MSCAGIFPCRIFTTLMISVSIHQTVCLAPLLTASKGPTLTCSNAALDADHDRRVPTTSPKMFLSGSASRRHRHGVDPHRAARRDSPACRRWRGSRSTALPRCGSAFRRPRSPRRRPAARPAPPACRASRRRPWPGRSGRAGHRSPARRVKATNANSRLNTGPAMTIATRFQTFWCENDMRRIDRLGARPDPRPPSSRSRPAGWR